MEGNGKWRSWHHRKVERCRADGWLASPLRQGSEPEEITERANIAHEEMAHRDELAKEGQRWQWETGKEEMTSHRRPLGEGYLCIALRGPPSGHSWNLRMVSALYFSQHSSSLNQFTYSPSTDSWKKGSKAHSPFLLSGSFCPITLSVILIKIINVDK